MNITLTVIMSATWLKLITVLCLSCTALSGPALGGQESSGVLWRDVGGAVTIQCRPPEPDQEILALKKGLSEDFDVLVKESNSDEYTIAKEFMGRLQLNGVFPSLDILIKNLTSDDTGPYWCSYTKFEQKSVQINTKKGIGSVLLVVTDTVTECDQGNKKLVLVSVVISAAVLLGIMMGFVIWIIFKNKTLCSTVKPRHATTNDVYEDMRGTLRR